MFQVSEAEEDFQRAGTTPRGVLQGMASKNQGLRYMYGGHYTVDCMLGSTNLPGLLLSSDVPHCMIFTAL